MMSKQEIKKLMGTSRDEMADILKTGHAQVIKETDDWRPLAGAVLELIALGIVYHESKKKAEAEARKKKRQEAKKKPVKPDLETQGWVKVIRGSK